MRDDECLRHAMSRSKQPKFHQDIGRTPVQVYVNYDGCNWKDHVETGRWLHVGTSPKISTFDKMQARRRFQTYMADS